MTSETPSMKEILRMTASDGCEPSETKPPDIAAGLKRWIGERDHPHAVYAARDVDALVSRCETAERELSLARLRWGYEELKREREEARETIAELNPLAELGQQIANYEVSNGGPAVALAKALRERDEALAEAERLRQELALECLKRST